MKDVFLDTVGLIAILNQSDQWRLAALASFETLKANRRGFITTNLILYEAANSLARTPLRAAISDLRDELRDQGRVIVPTDADGELGWSRYRSGDARDASIVDCISFVVMRRLGITEVFSNDRHFSAAGFQTLF